MSRRAPRKPDKSDPQAVVNPVAAWTWFLAVGAVLLGGAVLQSTPDTPGLIVAGTAPTANVVLPVPTHEAPATPLPSVSAPIRDLDRLEQRVERDLSRLLGSGDGWTAQLAVLCDSGRAEGLVDQFGDQDRFHVVPTYHSGESCFLACWGRYSSADAARAAADLPAGLRQVQPNPMPKRLAEIARALE